MFDDLNLRKVYTGCFFLHLYLPKKLKYGKPVYSNSPFLPKMYHGINKKEIKNNKLKLIILSLIDQR